MPASADTAAAKAVEVAAREIDRLAEKSAAKDGKGLTGFDAMDLEKYSKICLGYEDHRLHWISKLDPEKLSDELLKKALAEADGAPGTRARRASAG